MPKCRAPGCAETRTIKSHIIPQGFARWIRGDESDSNLVISPIRTTAKYPNGLFVTDILCAECDRRLGRELDEPFLDLSTGFAARHRDFGSHYWRVDDIDPVLIVRWILSVFWRVSVTDNREWQHINLGEFQDAAGRISFGADLSEIPELSVEIGRMKPMLFGKPFETDKVIALPWTKVVRDRRLFLLTVGGFRVNMKFDRLSHPNPLGALEVVGQRHLFGQWFVFENTLDHRKMIATLEAADERDRTRGIER